MAHDKALTSTKAHQHQTILGLCRKLSSCCGAGQRLSWLPKVQGIFNGACACIMQDPHTAPAALPPTPPWPPPQRTCSHVPHGKALTSTKAYQHQTILGPRHKFCSCRRAGQWLGGARRPNTCQHVVGLQWPWVLKQPCTCCNNVTARSSMHCVLGPAEK